VMVSPRSSERLLDLSLFGFSPGSRQTISKTLQSF
jgi:hypothetical protein